MIDVYFIEFYISRKYNQKLDDYFDVNSSVTSHWRNKNFPKSRLHEFCYREKSDDMIELLSRIYDLKKSE